MKLTEILTEIHPDFKGNTNTVFTAKIRGLNQNFQVTSINYKCDKSGKQIPFVRGHVVIVNADNDYRVERLYMEDVTLPYIIGVAFESAVAMRNNAMAIAAQSAFQQFNY